MEDIALISENPEKWEKFKNALAGYYTFVGKGLEDTFANFRIIAIDNFDTLEKIPSEVKKNALIAFFSEEYSEEKDTLSRRKGASEFFPLSCSEELTLLRFQKLGENAELLKRAQDSVRWLQATKGEMKRLQEGMSEVLASTVESRDENTGGHVVRTGLFMSILGEEFVMSGDLKREQLDLIVMAAPLHDIGKIAIHDSILLKPGPLSDEERTEMMSHPKRGSELIQKMQKRFPSHSYLKYAYDIALSHHERYDGKGYPNGAKGEQIPFWARLMSVVDVYDALVSDRIYRKGMSKEKAFEIIFEGKGTQFDPLILEGFDNCKDFLI
ncbi:hypothetical protein AGMMS49938_02830 [Fibrobacterales bacterium]|nr:hypothetical protein AGMMS49938_02830 [Fibrobacterales bacterium]